MDPLVLKEQIRLAFDGVPIPPDDDLPGDFRYFARGKHWANLPTAGLFLHRHALATFPPETFLAYIAAFMIGGLVDGPYETELLACALEALTPDRALDDRQRAAVAMFRDFAALRLGEVGIRNYARQQRARRDVQRQ